MSLDSLEKKIADYENGDDVRKYHYLRKKTHCKNGHPLNGGNVLYQRLASGLVTRRCKSCCKEYARTSKRNKAAKCPIKKERAEIKELMKGGLSQFLLKKVFTYCEKTGEFRWKINHSGGVKAGMLAGSINPSGYRCMTFCGKSERVHRLIWLYVYGYMPERIDHVNGEKADNRLDNLRLCSHSQNIANGRVRRNNTSGHKNVCWDKQINKWVVYVRENGKMKKMGNFDDLELAALVAHEAREKYYGEFARHE